ncbi:hypothetical protein OG225_39730 [Nocardia sp. NBC_01377]|uniref:hypothetical protein n=1 Tax=Nocardia sp. NBC_01377 TaxID=2903595 RepID=UPI00325195FB
MTDPAVPQRYPSLSRQRRSGFEAAIFEAAIGIGNRGPASEAEIVSSALMPSSGGATRLKQTSNHGEMVQVGEKISPT